MREKEDETDMTRYRQDRQRDETHETRQNGQDNTRYNTRGAKLGREAPSIRC